MFQVTKYNKCMILYRNNRHYTLCVHTMQKQRAYYTKRNATFNCLPACGRETTARSQPWWGSQGKLTRTTHSPPFLAATISVVCSFGVWCSFRLCHVAISTLYLYRVDMPGDAEKPNQYIHIYRGWVTLHTSSFHLTLISYNNRG